ncbi:MAG: ATP-binding protein [Oscillospiraceae bacterium]
MNLAKLKSFCAFNVKDDVVLTDFYCCGYENPEDYYSDIVNTLLEKGQTLGEYLHDLLVYSDSPVVAKCAKERTPALISAIEYDLSVIKELVSLSSEQFRETLSDSEILREMPDYDNGKFDFDADYFIDFARKNGTGIFAKYRAFSFDGELKPILKTDKITLADLKNYEIQRNQVVENTLCFLHNQPAQNVLLYGDRGTGKSSTVKAIFNEYKELRMVEVARNDINVLPALFEKLGKIDMKFIVTIDDLSFGENDDRFGTLKAVLEGSLAQRPENILIYATTNRRKIVRETVADREISGADAIDESMSLSDRFGLFVTFMRPDKQIYLDIVKKLAEDMGIDIPEERLFAAAERFSSRRGGRSPRVARQFVDWLKGRIELNLEY